MGCSNSKKVYIVDEKQLKRQKTHEMIKTSTASSIEDAESNNFLSPIKTKSAIFLSPRNENNQEHSFLPYQMPKPLTKGVSKNDLHLHRVIPQKKHIATSFCIDNAHDHEEPKDGLRNGAYFQSVVKANTGSGKSFNLQIGQIMSQALSGRQRTIVSTNHNTQKKKSKK